MRNDEFTAIALGLLSSLYNAAFRLTRDEHDAEDLVQDTYAYAFEHANELRSPAAAKTWLLRILYHRFISLRRTARAPRAKSSRRRPRGVFGGNRSGAAPRACNNCASLSRDHHQGHRAVARGASHRRGHVRHRGILIPGDRRNHGLPSGHSP